MDHYEMRQAYLRALEVLKQQEGDIDEEFKNLLEDQEIIHS